MNNILKNSIALFLVIAGNVYGMEEPMKEPQVFAEDFDLSNYIIYAEDFELGISGPQTDTTDSRSLVINSDETSNPETIPLKNLPKQLGRIVRWNEPEHPRNQKKSDNEQELDIIKNTNKLKGTKRKIGKKKTQIPCPYPNCEQSFSRYNDLSQQYRAQLIHVYHEHKTPSEKIQKCIENAVYKNNGTFIVTCPDAECSQEITTKQTSLKNAIIAHYYGTLKHNKSEIDEVITHIKECLNEKKSKK